MKKPAYIYARVSTDNQSHSLDAQEEKNGIYCQLADLEVLHTYTDAAVSGRIPLAQRPGGAALLAALSQGRVQDVVFAKIDRLGRNATDIGTTIEWLLGQGIRPHIVDLRIDCGTPLGKFMVQLLAAVAELEAANIRERIKVVIHHRRAHGFVVGTVPYGWREVADGNGERRLEEDASQLAQLRRIIAWKADGWGFDKIATQLNRDGVPTKTPAGQTYRRNGEYLLTTGRWNPGTVKRLLENNYTKSLSAVQL